MSQLQGMDEDAATAAHVQLNRARLSLLTVANDQYSMAVLEEADVIAMEEETAELRRRFDAWQAAKSVKTERSGG